MTETYRAHCDTCGKIRPHYSETEKCTFCASEEGERMLLETRMARAAKKAAKKKAQRKKVASKKQKKVKKQPQTVTSTPEEEEISREEKARREVARRALAKRHLLAFVKRYEPNYKAGWVHKVLCEELMKFSEAVVRGESPRLMITMPPRHGKSLVASQYFPAWHLGNHPEHEFINASYAQSLQMDFSRKIQELIKSKDYHLMFGNLGITKKNEAVERWSLYDYDKDERTGGGVLAAGVGGPITGRGAHVLIIDDPVKNREEAESVTVREAAKAWYSSTAYTRLAPGGGVLVIQTRWHDDDLSGYLLSEMREAEREFKETGVWPEDADRWRVIDFPAIATHDEKYRMKGEALHEERYPLAALKKIKRTLAPRDWAALYQQNPQVEEGAYFQKKHVRYYKTAPIWMDYYAAGDLAISKKEAADYTVFMVFGMDDNNDLYAVEEYRGRGWGTTQIIDTMFEIHRKYKPRMFGLEKGHISLTMEDLLAARKKEEGLFDLHIEELKPGRNDKEVRARSFQGMMELNKVYWPEGALWVDEHINELLRFPNGVKDDRVDADAWIGKMTANRKYSGDKMPRDKKKESWRKKLKDYVSGNKSSGNHMAA